MDRNATATRGHDRGASRPAPTPAGRPRHLTRAVGSIVAVLVAASCASGTTTGAPAVDGTSGTAPGTTPGTTERSTAEGDGQLVDIGAGRTMYLECAGTGSPTVVLISGTGNAADVWRYTGSDTDPADPLTMDDAAVFPTTARSTRVCAYDRPGTQLNDGSPGRSSPVPQPAPTEDDVADLHALLAAADVPGPYVLVAHSLGGLIATTYARTHPDQIAGLVLVDPASQFMETTMGPDAWSQYVEAARSRASTGGEGLDPAAANATIDALAPLPPVPAVVLSSDRPWFILPFGEGGALVDYSSALLESQTLLARSLGATHITRTNSAHDIYLENAPIVNEQICAVIRPGAGC